MPKKPAKDGMHYLTMHDGIWRVQMGVPKELRERIGATRLTRSTGESSKAMAKIARDKIVPEFEKRIAEAWEARGGKKRTIVAEGMALRRALREARNDPKELAYLRAIIDERYQEIIEGGQTEVFVEGDEESPSGWIPATKPVARQDASTLTDLAYGRKTPIAAYHQQFVDGLNIAARSKLDEPRALSILLDWLAARNIPPYIQNVDKDVAFDFHEYLQAYSDFSWASKAKYFGRIKFYWNWLVKKREASENPFAPYTIEKPHTTRADDERPYTDAEVQKLLMGSPMEGRKMLDVMTVAALTGARLDAVIDLKVANCFDGYFTFKAQKKERDSRQVPIHPDLWEIVTRRIDGKKPEDDLFPEWPAPPKTSVKPRSSYFSKRYTKYCVDIGVRDEEEGRRRSKINFHSWRRWFITKLERARVREPLIAAIVGHKRPGMTLGLYSGGPEFEEAIEAIALVKLPPLDGSPVVEARSLSPRRSAS